MAKVHDYATSPRKMRNTTYVYVWEVCTSDYDDRTDEELLTVRAVFFDPWKAVQYATTKFGVACSVQLSCYHIDNCKPI